MAVGLSPGGMKKLKSLRQFRSDLLSISTFSEKDKTQLATEAQKSVEEKEKEMKFPRKYRVVIYPGAMVKEKQELTSTEMGKLYIGTAVTVEEIQGRRARISEPLVGWLSLRTEGEKSRVILLKEGTQSPEMEEALHAERARQTKLLILKSITTLSDATVERLLEKSDWNLRNAIDAFYTAKYKTLEYVMKAQQEMKKKMKLTPVLIKPKLTIVYLCQKIPNHKPILAAVDHLNCYFGNSGRNSQWIIVEVTSHPKNINNLCI